MLWLTLKLTSSTVTAVIVDLYSCVLVSKLASLYYIEGRAHWGHHVGYFNRKHNFIYV